MLDTATSQIVAQIPVGASPHYAPFTPDGRQALAVVQGPGELAILDTASNTLAGTVAVGKAPHWSMSSADGRTAYVTNEGSNDVSVVDLGRRTVTATIALSTGSTGSPKGQVKGVESDDTLTISVPGPNAAVRGGHEQPGTGAGDRCPCGERQVGHAGRCDLCRPWHQGCADPVEAGTGS